jgi:2-oxoglutarate dehydrogenase E1 component
VGSIAYPPQYAGASPELIAELGISKVLTLTSTYDHRVIQGAESGAFLATVERLLSGEEGFYDRIFLECGVPHEPFRAAPDRHAGLLSATAPDAEIIRKQAAVLQLIRAYRVRGHLYAELDPLTSGPTPEIHPELALSTYGLSVWDLDRRFFVGNLRGSHGTLTLREVLEILRDTYCRHTGIEFMHIPEGEIRSWLQERMEAPPEPLPRDAQLRILDRLNVASAFERFLHTTYVGQKRFSLEGAETLIPMLDALLQDAAQGGVDEVVLGMAHRGRLNVIAHVVGKGAAHIFREFEGELDPATVQGSGDVKYHLGATGAFEAPSGRRLTVRLAANPSHLEAVDPVVEGMARARQDSLGDAARERVLPVLLHGDAAFAGQGVVVETLNLSELKGYRTGGTVHVVVNNQIGFTTGPADARSSLYATDVAKAVRAPILHVNGDVPEDAVRVIRLALAFRQRFKRDVVVDLVCYRRWGHNEADDPSYTAPFAVREDREAPAGARPLHRAPPAPGACSTSPRRRRNSRASGAISSRCCRTCRRRRGRPRPPRPPRGARPRSRRPRSPGRSCTGCWRAWSAFPRGSRCIPSWASSWRAAGSGSRAAASTGPWRRRSPWGLSCWTGRTCACPGEDTARGTFSPAAHHALRPPHGSAVHPAAAPGRGGRAASRCSTVSSRSSPSSGSSTGTAWPVRKRSCSGKRSSATS